MQHVDTLGMLAHVQYSMLHRCMYPNLVDTMTDRGHRLPVMRIIAELNQIQLVTGFSASIFREVTEFSQGRADKVQFLSRHFGVYNYLYNKSSPLVTGHLTLADADKRSIVCSLRSQII